MSVATTESSTVRSWRTSWWFAAVIGSAALLIGALGGYALADRDSGAEPVAGDDAVLVVGNTSCSRTSYREVGTIDGLEVIEEQFVCELVASDPRVSGTEQLTVTSRVGDWSKGGIWTATGNLTTADGAWRGSGRGVFSLAAGDLPGGAVRPPVNFGEMRYIGEGRHEGLVYEYYFVGTNHEDSRAGWIETAGGG